MVDRVDGVVAPASGKGVAADAQGAGHPINEARLTIPLQFCGAEGPGRRPLSEFGEQAAIHVEVDSGYKRRVVGQ